MTPNYQKGFSLVEVLIASSIVIVVGVFVGATITQFTQSRDVILDDTKKAYLAEEGYEILKFLRDENWTNLSSLAKDTHHYLQVSTTTLGIGGSSELIDDKYNRGFLLQSVHRNASGNIVASTTSGSVADDDSLKLFVYVGDDNSTTTMQAILTNLP